MIETLILGVGAFAGTNIDDIFIDTLLFAGAKTKEEIHSVVLGKYIGMAVLVSVSMLAARGLQFLPQQYIRYLGLVPIVLGIRAVLDCIRKCEVTCENEARKSGNQLINAALITIANGADNLGVYVPLFSGIGAWQTVEVVCVFAIMVAVWCTLGKKLSDLPVLKTWLGNYRHFIVPILYIILGLYLLFA